MKEVKHLGNILAQSPDEEHGKVSKLCDISAAEQESFSDSLDRDVMLFFQISLHFSISGSMSVYILDEFRRVNRELLIALVVDHGKFFLVVWIHLNFR